MYLQVCKFGFGDKKAGGGEWGEETWTLWICRMQVEAKPCWVQIVSWDVVIFVIALVKISPWFSLVFPCVSSMFHEFHQFLHGVHRFCSCVHRFFHDFQRWKPGETDESHGKIDEKHGKADENLGEIDEIHWKIDDRLGKKWKPSRNRRQKQKPKAKNQKPSLRAKKTIYIEKKRIPKLNYPPSGVICLGFPGWASEPAQLSEFTSKLMAEREQKAILYKITKLVRLASHSQLVQCIPYHGHMGHTHMVVMQTSGFWYFTTHPSMRLSGTLRREGRPAEMPYMLEQRPVADSQLLKEYVSAIPFRKKPVELNAERPIWSVDVCRCMWWVLHSACWKTIQYYYCAAYSTTQTDHVCGLGCTLNKTTAYHGVVISPTTSHFQYLQKGMLLLTRKAIPGVASSSLPGCKTSQKRPMPSLRGPAWRAGAVFVLSCCSVSSCWWLCSSHIQAAWANPASLQLAPTAEAAPVIRGFHRS